MPTLLRPPVVNDFERARVAATQGAAHGASRLLRERVLPGASTAEAHAVPIRQHLAERLTEAQQDTPAASDLHPQTHAHVDADADADAMCRRVDTALQQHRPGSDLRGMASSLRALLTAGLGRLPLPGSGQTLQRWRALIKVGSVDLALLKLYEAHTDAHAILAELGGAVAMRDGELWGVWCAEPPDGRVNMIRHADGMVSLHGTKRWCSGAGIVDQGLVSAWNEAGEQCLVAVPMHQPGVRVNHDGWNAVGMVATQTSNIHFSGALGTQVGAPGAYVERPGFWHGGAGIAACWFGGASGIAQALLHAARLDVHGLARLGQCEVALHAAAALLREAAAAIDADPQGDARHVALRARLGVETAASAVIAHASLALGPAPLCNDSRVARLVADLPIYLRQSHGDRDFAALGTQLRDTSTDPEKEPPWMP